LSAAKTPPEKTALERQIAATDKQFGSSIISVGGCDGLSVVIGHGDWEFTSYKVEHVDEAALGAIATGLSLDG